MNGELPTREVFWNVTHVWVMYVLLIPTMLVAGYGIYRRFRTWCRGRPEQRFDQPWKRLSILLPIRGLLACNDVVKMANGKTLDVYMAFPCV